jgi:hypothetical protein
MIRKLTFGFIVATAFIVAACGRQVTPNPPGVGSGGAPLGYMAVYMSVASPFNFSSYQYMFVFNTTGSGVTPSTDTLQTNWAGYSYDLIALGNGATAYAKPVALIRNSNPNISPAWLPLGTTPAQFSFNPNTNGAGTEFSMLFQQRIFSYSASPSPSPTSSALPYARTWTFNAFVTQASSQGPWYFLDSMGAGGPVDPQFVSPSLCITEAFDNTYYGLYTPSDPSAQIVSVEIANNPVHPTPCP